MSNADFKPTLGDYNDLRPFRYWCQKVLPLVYDDSLSYYELLCKVVDYLNKTMQDVGVLHDDVVNINAAYGELESYVNQKLTELETFMNNYFDNLNVQQEINNKLDEMVNNGEFNALIKPLVDAQVSQVVTNWLQTHVTPTGSVVTLDSSMSIQGSAADAKAVGQLLSIKAGGQVGSANGTAFTQFENLWDVPGGYYLMWSNAVNALFPNNPFGFVTNTRYAYVFLPKMLNTLTINQGFTTSTLTAYALVFYSVGNTNYCYLVLVIPDTGQMSYIDLSLKLDNTLTIDTRAANSKTVGDLMSIKAGGQLGNANGQAFSQFENLWDVPAGYYLMWSNAVNKLFPNNPFGFVTNTRYAYVMLPKMLNNLAINQGFTTDLTAYALVFYSVGTVNYCYLVLVVPDSGQMSYVDLSLKLDNTLTIDNRAAVSKTVGDLMSLKAGGQLGNANGQPFAQFENLWDVPAGYYLMWSNAVNKLFPNNPFGFVTNTRYAYVMLPKMLNNVPINQGFTTNLTAYALVFYSVSNVNYCYLVLVVPDTGQVTQYCNLTNLIDTTLSKAGYSADSKAVGEAIDTLYNEIKIFTAPNGKKYLLSVNNDGDIFTIPLIPKNAIFIGNSLLLGFGEFGMAASDYEHDYFYLLTSNIDDLNSTKISGNAFEECEKLSDAQTWITSNVSTFNAETDFIMIQLGDNINTETKRTVFTQSCKNLITACKQQCPKARIVWAYGWYKNEDVENTIVQSCKETDTQYINFINNGDTSSIGNVYTLENSSTQTYTVDSFSVNDNNMTLDFTVEGNSYSSTITFESYSVIDTHTVSVTGKEKVIVNSGVASHPGDDGFNYIAETMKSKLGW